MIGKERDITIKVSDDKVIEEVGLTVPGPTLLQVDPLVLCGRKLEKILGLPKLPKIVCRSMSLTLFPASHRILGSYRSGEVVLPRLAVRLEYQVPSTLPVPNRNERKGSRVGELHALFLGADF
ncbi:hypothetical protein H5410_040223 [Solanum commersonii]|uniref:Uncharacterized protein n=1 Tax=Solanum commersonii TaxID=4109 RepID=A0A9J5XPH0_SOLCO|nr:hypothetical protein H5410_040223 [Solanum commersonii]